LLGKLLLLPALTTLASLSQTMTKPSTAGANAV
jgi:hypothetical protein